MIQRLIKSIVMKKNAVPDRLESHGQVTKCIRWMPRRQKAMKDVVACDKPRGAGKQALIRGCPNGETRPFGVIRT